MALLDILQVPHPALKSVAKPVAEVTDELRLFMQDMLETMYKAPGIGLAAPQVGVLHRLLVIDVGKEEERAPMFVVNPEILWRSEEQEAAEEGCLSLPEQFAEVRRPCRVRVGYQDQEGQPREIEADGLLARCLQHEIDHLNGVLFVDHISALRRNMILRKLAKQQRARD
jgi:peptide deformylase